MFKLILLILVRELLLENLERALLSRKLAGPKEVALRHMPLKSSYSLSTPERVLLSH